MKTKTSPTATRAAHQPAAPARVLATVLDHQPIPTEPLTQPFRSEEDPGARGTHGSAGREEIRQTTHRVMGSRQSQRPIERHNQPRQKRG